MWVFKVKIVLYYALNLERISKEIKIKKEEYKDTYTWRRDRRATQEIYKYFLFSSKGMFLWGLNVPFRNELAVKSQEEVPYILNENQKGIWNVNK